MNSAPPHPSSGDERELRLTALLLGELSEADAAVLRLEIAANAELRKLHDELARTIGLVREARGASHEKTGPAVEPLTLSSDKRNRLLAAFKTVPLPAKTRKPRFIIPWREAASVAAMLAMLAGIATVVMHNSVLPEDRLEDSVAFMFGIEAKYKPPGAVTALSADASSGKELAANLAPETPPALVGRANASDESELFGMDEEWKTRGGAQLKAVLQQPSSPPSSRTEVAAQDARRFAGAAPAKPAAAVNASSPDPDRRYSKRYANSLPSVGVPAGGAGQDTDLLLRHGEPARPSLQFGTIVTSGVATSGTVASGSGGGLGGGGGHGARPARFQFFRDVANQPVADPAASAPTGQPAMPPPAQALAWFGQSLAEADRPGTAPVQLGDRMEAAQRSQNETWGFRSKLPEDSNLSEMSSSFATDKDLNQAVATSSGQTLNQWSEQPEAKQPVAGLGVPSREREVEQLADASVEAGLKGLSVVRQSADGFYADFHKPTPAAIDALSVNGRVDGGVPRFSDANGTRGALAKAKEPPGAVAVKSESLLRRNTLSDLEVMQAGSNRGLGRKSYIALPKLETEDSGVIIAGKPAQAGPQPVTFDKKLQDQVASRSRSLTERPEVELQRAPAPNASIPQPEVATADNAFSTFSLNVADVSFKLAAASLEKGAMPDVSTIRSEEFINAFDYRDPVPAPGVPIAFATERARYPFAHDRDLVRFSVKTAAVGRQPGKPFNIVLAIDNSGSMERADRVRILQECLRVLGRQLQPEDRISIVSFARTARLWLDGVPAVEAGDLAARVGSLAPEGGTNLEEAMILAYKTALRHFVPGGVNRVVLITDGAANLGDVEPDSLKQKVEAHRKQGIALDCFGIGWDGFNDDLLEVLSRNGDGRYGFINTPEAAATEFAGQLAGALKVAASDVKVQVEWNPRRVTSYRQIGYAKHQLKKEQFRDNTVDAAEIGAAEAGNALYTVQVNPSGEGPLATVRVRFRVPNTSDYREHEWIVPYATPAPALDQASSTLRLAATASAFSEWLVASPFATEVTPAKLLGYLRGIPENLPADPRPKQLETMIRQAKTISGQ